EVGEQVMDLLAGREVWFSPESQVTAVDEKKGALSFRDGTDARYDLLIAVPGHKSSQVVKDAGLVKKGEWVSVDRETLATAFDGVYAIGDVTAIPLANGLMLPKAGVFAHGEAEVVARNIAAEVNGSRRWSFGGEGACFLEAGYGKAAYAVGKFFAEPEPQVKLRNPSPWWHWAKRGYERLWLRRWF
ncbi:MAG: FAD-dependent oxidoreductase, partial [Dehalococcoidia bacterium]